MMGVQHKAFGIATGCLLAVYAAEQGDSYLSMTLISAVPIGCMWPDIDHHNSKLGRKKNEIFMLLSRIIVTTFIISALVIFVTALMNKRTVVSALWQVLASIGPIAVITWIPTSNFMKKKFKFFRKHRGVLHTTVPAFGLLIATNIIDSRLYIAILIALGIGYATHLFTDWETTDGIPGLWPLTEKCVRIPIISVDASSPLCWLFVAVDTVLVYYATPYIYKFMEVFTR